MLEPFTTNPSVREVYGLTESELSDERLNLPMYEANLRVEFAEIGDDMAEDFVTVNEKAESERSTVEVNFHAAVQLFSPYVVAMQLMPSLALLATKSITDGKAAVSRHSEAPFEEMKRDCRQMYERFRQYLEKAYAAYSSTAEPVSVSTPTLLAIPTSVDPVTGV